MLAQKLQTILSYVPAQEQEKLRQELKKILPLPTTKVLGKTACNYDQETNLVHSSISFKTQIDSNSDSEDILSIFLDNVETDFLKKLEKSMDFILLNAQKPYQLHFLPSLQTQEGIGIIYFTISSQKII